MAVLGRLLVSSAERLDLPDLLSLDSYAAGDWKYFLKGLVGDSKPYILKGFDIIDPGNAIGTQGCSIRVADSVVFYPGSNAGGFFHGLQEGHEQATPLVPELRKNAVNYVYLTFSTLNTSVDTRAFWDPDKDGGVGGEFTQDVNTESVLKVEVNVSTGSFPANTIPVAKVTVGPVVITAIEDARDLMFRLGNGGISPNPFNQFEWRSLPSASYDRNEPPTQMLAGGTNPFQGADKNILTLKEWMDAVMSKLRELGGTTYWYEDTSSFGIVTNFFDAVATAFKSKGKWLHDTVTPGLVTWTEDINIKMTSDPRTYIIRQGSKNLSDEQVMYVPMVRNQQFNATDESVSWTNGQPYINTIGGAVGLFTELSKGDWVKKASDSFDKWLRVEEFYDAVSLGGSTTTAANARSVRLSGNYQGTTGSEKGRYDQGAYLAAEVVVSDRDDATIANTGGNFHWLAMRSDTIQNVNSIVSTALTINISEHDGSTAKVTSTGAHNLVDGDRVTIANTTNFDGTYKVEVESATVFYIDISGGPHADEAGDAFYATVTSAARSTAYGFQEESANHGFETDDDIIIDGTTNFDGSYEINVRSATTFTIPVPSNIATENTGTATLARVIVRTEGSVEQLIQGQIISIGGGAADNIRQYLGMGSLSETAPTYSVPVSYNTLDGMANYNGVLNENITSRVSKLTAMMADKAQDKTIKALPSSGITSINNTTNGGAQEITFSPPGGSLTFVTPGSDGQAFVTLPGVAPGISLLINQLAYVEIDRNAPSSPAIQIANIADVEIDENIFVIAVRLATTDVYVWDGSIITTGSVPGPGFSATIVKQNQMLKLVEGGTWDWDLSTETLTWDANAFVQIPNLANTVNQIAAGSVVLSAGEVAWVSINRVAPGGALTVNVSTNATLVPTTDMFILARRENNDVIVGLHSMRLIDGESKSLYAATSDQTLTYIGATNAADNDPNYAGPNRNITQGESLTSAVNSLDVELDKFFGQLQLRADSPASTRLIITGVDFSMLNTTVLGQELVGLLMKFDGAEIDFATGDIYESDGITPLGQNFTPATIAAGQFRWYSVSLIPDALDAQNRITAQVLVLPASADGASAATAPRAVFGGTKKLGQVVVQDDGAGGSGTILNINQDDVVQLGVGSGSGGSGAAPKLIGGGTFSWNSGTNELSFTSDIYVEQARLAYADNTIDQGTVSPITLPTANHVAYIERLNASSGGPNLTVLIDLITNVKDGQVIIARRDGSDVIVGSSSMRLVNGESKSLYAGVSNQLLNVIPASNNADSSGQLRLLQNTASPKRVNVSAVDKNVPDGTEYNVQLKNLLLDFDGAQIDFDTGSIYEEDGVTALGIDFTPAVIAASQFRWYSVTLVPNAVTGDNKISGQLVVIAADADGVSAVAAPKAAFASTGIKLGQVVVQESGGSIANIVQSNIVQLSVGGSAGGEGDANELLERIKDRLVNAPFEWADTNIFLTDEEDKIDTATASFDVANTLYKFTGIGQNIVSIQSLDPEFLTEEKDVDSVELMAFWNPGAIDSNATYEVSRNGGVDWETIDMERVGLTTETFRGILAFPQDTTYINLHEWVVANATAYRELNTTTLQAIGQPFDIASGEAENLQRAILYINKVGSPVGYTYVQLVRDNAGQPSTDLLDIVAQAQVLNSGLAAGDNAVTLTWGTNVMQAGTYHFVIATDAAYKAGFSAGVNSVRARVDDSAPVGPDDLSDLNAGVWSTTAGQTLIYRVEGRPLDLRVRITSSAGAVELKGYGIFYGRQDQVVTGIKNREVQQFDGTIDNFNTFTLTNFLPDPDLLKVYHVETGQVYLPGTNGFSLNGHQVVFPADTFNGLGTVTLVFDQLVGTSFDNSDSNAALLAANFLGSTDASIDRSQNGRGIFLRRPDGTLREITIDNNDQIVIYSV